HLCHVRQSGAVPVPVSKRSLPRRDREDTYEQYCRVMLILFKPWKTPHDLRTMDDDWCTTFSAFRMSAPLRVLKIIDNIQLTHECRDSKDELYSKRRVRSRGYTDPG